MAQHAGGGGMSELSAVTDLAEAFRCRCEARAYLWAIGEYHLDVAVDILQADAVKQGLVTSLGQDAAQSIMAAAFEMARRDPLLMPSSPVRIVAKPEEKADTPASLLQAAAWLRFEIGDSERLKRFLERQTLADRVNIVKYLRKRHESRRTGAAGNGNDARSDGASNL
jgi:hypothetical protein